MKTLTNSRHDKSYNQTQFKLLKSSKIEQAQITLSEPSGPKRVTVKGLPKAMSSVEGNKIVILFGSGKSRHLRMAHLANSGINRHRVFVEVTNNPDVGDSFYIVEFVATRSCMGVVTSVESVQD